MASKIKSRWADNEEDAATDLQRKREKEEKKRAKALRLKAETQPQAESGPPPKRRRLSPQEEPAEKELPSAKLLRGPSTQWGRCRSVEEFEKLNDIEEGAYGMVSRAREIKTGKVVALKRLKMEGVNDGVPVTGLREIQALMRCEHRNIVGLQEVVVGDDMSKIERYFFSPSFPFLSFSYYRRKQNLANKD